MRPILFWVLGAIMSALVGYKIHAVPMAYAMMGIWGQDGAIVQLAGLRMIALFVQRGHGVQFALISVQEMAHVTIVGLCGPI